MQAGVVVAEVVDLQILQGLNDLGRDQQGIVVDPTKRLQRVQEHGGRGTEQ